MRLDTRVLVWGILPLTAAAEVWGQAVRQSRAGRCRSSGGHRFEVHGKEDGRTGAELQGRCWGLLCCCCCSDWWQWQRCT